MSSRSLDDLSPMFRPCADAFLQQCETYGLDVLVYCTLRSLAEQASLYAQGRTTPGRIVTNARPGSSAHNFGLALDGVPLLNGKPIWDEPLSGPNWQLYAQAARRAGCQWGGDWIGSLVEGPHVEIADWRSYIPPPQGALPT